MMKELSKAKTKPLCTTTYNIRSNIVYKFGEYLSSGVEIAMKNFYDRGMDRRTGAKLNVSRNFSDIKNVSTLQ